MKRILTILLSFIFVFTSMTFVSGCNEKQYKITVTNDDNKGAVTGVVDGESYSENTVLNITVTPVIGYILSSVKWNKEKIGVPQKGAVSFSKTLTEDSSLQVLYKVDPDIDDKYLFSADVSLTDTADAVIDFGSFDGSKVNNLKKIDGFAPGHPLTEYNVSGRRVNERAKKNFKTLKEIAFDNFRCDFNTYGIMTNELKRGDWSDPDKTLANVFDISDELNKNNTLLQLIILQHPDYVWSETGGKISMPDITKYKSYMQNLSSAVKASGRRILYETWNEPDLMKWAGGYWDSGANSFIDMNCESAVALKKGDPEAFVIETALCWPKAFVTDYWDYYMRKTKEVGNKIDAFSWHYYGDIYGNIENTKDPTESLSYWKNVIRNKINAYNETYDLHTMAQYMTEFAQAANGARSSDVTCNGAIPKIYGAIEELLCSTDIAKVDWAAFYMPEALTMITTDDKNEKTPLYYALWAYSRLPITNAKTTVKNAQVLSDFFVRAGVDSKRASAIITNNVMNPSYSTLDYYVQRVEDSRTVNVKLKNIPSNANSFRIHLIDAVHTKGENESGIPFLVKNVGMENVKNGQVTLTLKIPGNASFYIEIDENGKSDISDLSDLYSNIVRHDFYYEDRADNMPYSDVYERALNVTMGMLSHETGKTATCITFDGMKEFNNISTKWRLSGDIKKGVNQGLGVRVDYHTAEGYTYSKTYRIGNGKFTYSGFGTGKDSDDYELLSLSDGVFDIPLKQNAPEKWDGKIQVLFFMENAGANTMANVTLSGK